MRARQRGTSGLALTRCDLNWSPWNARNLLGRVVVHCVLFAVRRRVFLCDGRGNQIYEGIPPCSPFSSSVDHNRCMGAVVTVLEVLQSPDDD